MRGHGATVALACLVLGALLLVVVDHRAARGAGVALLVAFIAIGTWAIATPEMLGPEGDDAGRCDPEGRDGVSGP